MSRGLQTGTRRSRGYRPRRKTRRFRLLPLLMPLLLVAAVYVAHAFLITDIGNEKIIDDDLSWYVYDYDVDVYKQLDSLHGYTKIDRILDNINDYPQVLLELALKNTETIDFVVDYPDMKDTSPAADTGIALQGEIPLYIQWDKRWGYSSYGDGIIATSGCGPTALAMVAGGMNRDSSITPHTVARFAEENGYYSSGYGSSWTLLYSGCEEFGLTAEEITLSWEAIEAELAAGRPIIARVGAGDFTENGHFIVITDAQDGKLMVNDPNSNRRSRLWEWDKLSPQMTILWAYHLS